MPEPDTLTLVSVHDVMPETFALCEELVHRLSTRGVTPLTLLIVPGRRWKPRQVERMRAWAEAGHELAAHGWSHQVHHIRGWKHRLHAWLISRRVAEHMELRSAGILNLLRRSSAWFERESLPRPKLYVPPAWALGPISDKHLEQAPYAMIETLRGVCDPRLRRWRRLPLVGFEADTPLRALALRLWNWLQLRRARREGGQPLRIAIHPQDFELHLARDLDAVLRQPQRFTTYSSLELRWKLR